MFFVYILSTGTNPARRRKSLTRISAMAMTRSINYSAKPQFVASISKNRNFHSLLRCEASITNNRAIKNLLLAASRSPINN